MTHSLFLRENLWRHISKTRRATRLKFCTRNAFMAIMTDAKFHFSWLMLTLIFGIQASEPPPPPRAWRKTEKAGPDRVNIEKITPFWVIVNYVLNNFVLSVLSLDHIKNVFLCFLYCMAMERKDLKFVHSRAEKRVGRNKVCQKKGLHIRSGNCRGN